MFPDEEEIRRGLSRRALRTGAEAWPEVARRLKSRSPARVHGGLALVAVLVVLVGAVWLRQATAPHPKTVARGFQVSRVEKGGKPSTALVLQPDRDTLLVVVPE